MAKVKFVIPEELLGSKLFTKTGQWLHEEKLVDFSFSFNKNVKEIPLDLHNSYYVAGDGVVFSALEEEKLDRVLETIKLYLKPGSADLETPENLKVVAPEVVSPDEEVVENTICSDVGDFVSEAMFRLSVMSVKEQNWAMEELYNRVQKNRLKRVGQLENDIEEVKESSHTLHEIFSKLKPEWLKRKSR